MTGKLTTRIEHRKTANNALLGSYAYLWNAQGLRSREDSVLTAITYGCRADYVYDVVPSERPIS